jgi:hypothetical protein
MVPSTLFFNTFLEPKKRLVVRYGTRSGGKEEPREQMVKAL